MARVRQWLSAPDDVADWVVETSGSTGAPKRVRLSREAVRASVRATGERLDFDGGWALALPPDYVAGLMVIARSLVAGHEPVLVAAGTGSARPDLGGRAISLVPTQLLRLLDEAEDADPDEIGHLDLRRQPLGQTVGHRFHETHVIHDELVALAQLGLGRTHAHWGASLSVFVTLADAGCTSRSPPP